MDINILSPELLIRSHLSPSRHTTPKSKDRKGTFRRELESVNRLHGEGKVTGEGKALSGQVGESTKRNDSTSTGIRRLQVLAFVEIYTPLSTCPSPQRARLRLGLGERKLLGYKERR